MALPEDPRLARVAEELSKTGGASMITDTEYRLVWLSPELRLLLDEESDDKLGIGKHLLEAYTSDVWSSKTSMESQMTTFFEQIPYMLGELPGGKEQLKQILVTSMRDRDDFQWPGFEGVSKEELFDVLFEQLEPKRPPAVLTGTFDFIRGDLPVTPITETAVRLHDPDTGEYVGVLFLYDPGLPARVLDLVARGDHGMLERMARLVQPGRRQAAVLFADMQASGEISRRLPSAAYFKLMRTLVTAIDDVIVRHGGIVGKHVGDGVTAFFLAEDIGSPSGAARAAIEAGRDVSIAAGRIAKEAAEETGLIEADTLHVNVGVHWGANLYMGQLVTNGRLEVTALGDAVNECARIQESAREGQALASKNLIEHLAPDDAAAVGIDPDGVVYRSISELPGVTTKALRDAGALPVTVL